LIAVVLLLLSLPARAQRDETITVRLSSFSGWAAPDRPLSVSLEVHNGGSSPLTDVAVRLTIRERVRSRSALRASLDGNASGQPLAVTTEQYDQPIEPGQSATIPVERDLGSLANTFRSGRGIGGVYPLDIDVRVGGRDAAEKPSAFAFLASPPVERINLVWFLPIHRPLLSNALGAYDKATVTRELIGTERVSAIAAMLTAHATAPLTLAPSGLLADQLQDLSNGFPTTDGQSIPATDPLATSAAGLLARLRSSLAAPAFQIASEPYARAPLPSLLANGLTADAGRQVLTGRDRVTQVLGRAPDPALLVDGSFSADARSARTFAALGAKTIVIDPAILSARTEGRFGPERFEEVTAGGQTFDALIVDAPIRERMELPSDDPVLTAMGVAAETAMSYFELPGLASGRMIVVATSTMPDPAIARPLLDVLAQAPWVAMRTAGDADTDAQLRPAGEPLRLDVAPANGGDRAKQSRAARRQVDLLERILVSPSGDEELARLDRIVMATESADYDLRTSSAISLARAARARARYFLGRVTVPARRVTLTSRGGQVPVTVVNRTGFNVRVRVRLDSVKVTFPTGSSRVIEIPGKEHAASLGTLAFELEARAAGSFPVDVKLETVEGRDVIGTGQIIVRSSAVSAVTFMATAGGALFLVGAWARRALSRRTKRDATA
jgi:uncharacterized protein DUF6049